MDPILARHVSISKYEVEQLMYVCELGKVRLVKTQMSACHICFVRRSPATAADNLPAYLPVVLVPSWSLLGARTPISFILICNTPTTQLIDLFDLHGESTSLF